MADDERLSVRAREIMSHRNERLLWSAASTWELAIKASLGKVRLPEPVGSFVERRLHQHGIEILQITHAHAAAVQDLPMYHRDPFDRLLVAQARSERVPLLSGDDWLQAYDVEKSW